jgi:N-acetylmuramoyl-L-alanine amidase
MKVIINAGHSSTDPGFMGPTGTYEYEIVASLCRVLEQTLRERQIAVQIISQPGGNIQWALNHLAQKISEHNDADYLLSIHCGKAEEREAYGTRVVYLPDAEDGKLLAARIQQRFPRTLWSGTEAREDYILRQARCTAVLVEIDYISNPEVETLMQTQAWRKKVAKNVVEGILEDIESSQDIRLFIDDKEVYVEPAPQEVYNDVMVPVRLVAHALGGRVEWDRAQRIVRIHTFRPPPPPGTGKEQ